ncbi:hypothetical protein [Ruminococcus sp.]|uniref:hypothetical protein n=1 Tax=Ruminococcus sp. TaxID=41978 RepID=UPI003868F960
MMNVMKRAWEIYRTLIGDHTAKLAMALRQAWAEAKNTTKTAFEGFAKVAKCAETYHDCHFLTFKLWEKGDKKRIYINDYKRRTLGYIENGNTIINDRQGNTQEEIDYALNAFNATYAY